MEKNYVVYQHVTPDGMYYFGATQNVEKRWECNGIHYKRTSLQPYIEKYGWENIKHIVLFRDQSKEDALFIEDFLITTAQEDGVCINKQRSGLITKKEGYDKQYREQNKDKKSDYNREYYEQNKEQILEQTKQYYEQNKEQILDKNKQYREQNRDKIKETSKQYYEQNKDKIREQRRQRYQQKKEEKQFKEFGCLPLW